MKPVHHLLFGFILVMGFFLLFIPEQITLSVVFLAVVSGFLPDFDHREWLWKLVMFAVFVGFFFFFGNAFLEHFPGDEVTAGALAFVTAAVIALGVYAAHPFTGTIMDLSEKRTQFWGAEGWFLAIYVLVVFAATLSPALAVAAFIGYSSHWVLDAIAYYTYFGRKNLVNYPHPEKGAGWQIKRLQREEIAKREALARAKKEKESKQARNSKANAKKNGKKKAKKHGFLWGAGLTEESHDYEPEPGVGDHSLASPDQIAEAPELHHEEAHGESGAGH